MGRFELILLALGDDSSLSIALRRELIHVDRVEAAVQLAQLVVRLAHLGLLASDIKLGRDILEFGILHLTEGHGLVVIYFGEKIRLNFQHVIVLTLLAKAEVGPLEDVSDLETGARLVRLRRQIQSSESLFSGFKLFHECLLLCLSDDDFDGVLAPF